MKRWVRIASNFAAFCAFSAQAIPHLDAGIPGCLRLIIEHPMSDQMAKELTPNCQDLRAAYLGSLDLYAKSPKSFEKELTRVLKANQRPEPAYRAILLAAIFNDRKLIPALETRARFEEKKNLPHRYAVAAIERIKKGECTKKFADPAYDEVCRMRSPVAIRIIELSSEMKGDHP